MGGTAGTGKPVVGFVGVGLMGWGMAKNAVEKGWPLRVCAHRKREAVDDLVGRGAVEVGSIEEMGRSVEIAALCVTGAPEVTEAIAKLTAEGSTVRIIIDTSTSLPDVTRALAAGLAEKGVTLIDAPLSRTPSHAWEGQLTTYVSGDAAAVAECRDLLGSWASVVIETGAPVGAAQTLKLANNLVAVGYTALWAEAYALVRRVGAKPETFREIITNSGMNCGNFQNFSKYPCEGDASGHKFSLSNSLKDIRYYSSIVDAMGLSAMASKGVLEALKAGVNLGMGERMMPEMADVFATLNGDRPWAEDIADKKKETN
jgi:3-hydroxyisobutyrate dehydrogenase-like beta-hydroxyacid dehydrogenase